METSLLVVEDEADFADYLRRGLTYEGYRISLASSGEAGLELVRQLRPDLVILDANPLVNIRNTRSIDQVMLNGVLYSGRDASRVYPDPQPARPMYFQR